MNLPGQKPNITQRERETTQSFQTSSPKHSSLLSVVKRLCQFCRYHSIHTCLFCGHQFTNPQSLLALVTTTAASHKRQSQVWANGEDSRSRLIPEVLWGLLERKSWIVSECESGHQVCRTTEGLRKEQKGRPNICREPCAIFFQFLPLPFHIVFLYVEDVGLIAIIWRCYLWHCQEHDHRSLTVKAEEADFWVQENTAASLPMRCRPKLICIGGLEAMVEKMTVNQVSEVLR